MTARSLVTQSNHRRGGRPLGRVSIPLCPGRSCVVSALHLRVPFRVAYAADGRTNAIDAASRCLRRAAV